MQSKYIYRTKCFTILESYFKGNLELFWTEKTTNWRKATYFFIYFLPLMSYSIYKLNFQVLFTSKSFVFSDLTLKKNFCSIKWWVTGDPPAPWYLRP